MRNNLFIVLTIILISGRVNAQCNAAIPSNAIVVNTNDTVNGGFDPIWVCTGDTIHTDGGFHNIYLETGAVMTSGGGIDTVFMKKGSAIFMNGGIHYIYYQDPADLHIAGGIPTLDSCAAITFNYATAPVNGCFVGPVAFFSSSDTGFCSGTCINFTDQSNGAMAWQWIFTGATPATSTLASPQNICYSSAGNYDVTLMVTNTNGSDTLTLPNFIKVLAVPAVIPSQNGNTLTVTQGYAGYQWYFGNVILNGAVTNSYTAFQNGNYSVVVTDSNGCDTTVVFIFASQGMYGMQQQNLFFEIIPNPAHDFISVRLNRNMQSASVNQYDIEIWSAEGQKIFSRHYGSAMNFEIALGEFSPGIYLIKCMSDGENYFQKFIKE